MIDFSVGCDGPDDEISNLKRRILELERSEAASREELESSRKNLSDTLFRYENLIDKSRSIILEWDTDGTILFLNAWGQELFGYTERELVGRNVVGTIVPPTDDRGENLVEKMIRVERNPDEFYSSENVNIRKSGEQLWISWTNIGVRDRDGKIFKTLSIGIDRTIQHRQELTLLRHSEELESKVAERTRELSETICARTRELEEIRKMTEALQTSEERFRLSMEATHDGLWDWDIRTDRAYFSPGYYRMLGYRVDEFDANGTAWADMVHPDDRAKALRGHGRLHRGSLRSFRERIPHAREERRMALDTRSRHLLQSGREWPRAQTDRHACGRHEPEERRGNTP
jgi:PAS domain S-box-containing protein